MCTEIFCLATPTFVDFSERSFSAPSPARLNGVCCCTYIKLELTMISVANKCICGFLGQFNYLILYSLCCSQIFGALHTFCYVYGLAFPDVGT